MAKTEGSYLKFLKILEKVPLVILDDFRLQSLTKNLLQITEDHQYAKKSIIIISQLPVSKWDEYLDKPTIVDTIIDSQMSADKIAVRIKEKEKTVSFKSQNNIFINPQKLFDFWSFCEGV